MYSDSQFGIPDILTPDHTCYSLVQKDYYTSHYVHVPYHVCHIPTLFPSSHPESLTYDPLQ
jgi:dihydroorotase-like cyclic amidohydrolase